MNKQTDTIDLNRRDFLRGSALSSLAVALGATALQGQDKPAEATAPTAYKTAANPVNVAVLGLGQRGRDVLKTLSLLVNANVVAICDHYEPMVRRSKDLAPKAVAYSDYKELLADKNVKAIVLCTPTHQHKDLAIEIMKAGKHIYCEAPLASTVEDSKAIAAAAKDYQKVHFSSGLQLRSDPQRYFLLSFIRSGAMGKNVKAHAQWHKKQSWRQSSPNPDREREMNWKLDSKVSTGLAGEIAVHQIDTGRWFIEGAPLSITAFGSLINWNDGRKVQDRSC